MLINLIYLLLFILHICQTFVFQIVKHVLILDKDNPGKQKKCSFQMIMSFVKGVKKNYLTLSDKVKQNKRSQKAAHRAKIQRNSRTNEKLAFISLEMVIKSFLRLWGFSKPW